MVFYVSKQHNLSNFVMNIRIRYVTSEKKLQKMLSVSIKKE